MEKSVVLGIDIGGTNTIYGFIMRDGTIIFHDEIPTYGAKPISDLIGRISDNVKRFFSKNLDYSLSGIGIGAPNGNHYTGMIQSPPNLSWGNIDIVSLFKKEINAKKVWENHPSRIKNNNMVICEICNIPAPQGEISRWGKCTVCWRKNS